MTFGGQRKPEVRELIRLRPESKDAGRRGRITDLQDDRRFPGTYVLRALYARSDAVSGPLEIVLEVC